MLQDARIESRVLMIEDPEARLLREIIFVFWKNNVVQSRSCSDILIVNQCLGGAVQYKSDVFGFENLSCM